MNTHGGANATAAYYAMWDQNSQAYTSGMRFGDGMSFTNHPVGRDLMGFATFVCDTLKTSDGRFWNRWSRAFSGGLEIALGGHDLLYMGNTQMGTEFAHRLQGGEPIGHAWLEDVWYADNNNHPSVANTGVNANDCWQRMGSNMSTVQGIPHLRDSAIGYVCWAGWNGM
jgi:hypothetical protein